MSPPEMKFTFRAPLDSLPYFNPDIEQEGLPLPVEGWRAEIRDHAALVICSPEYAHGVPGVLKNALDWLVGASKSLPSQSLFSKRHSLRRSLTPPCWRSCG